MQCNDNKKSQCWRHIMNNISVTNDAYETVVDIPKINTGKLVQKINELLHT